MRAQRHSARLFLLTSVFALTALILMFVGSTRCNFIKFTDTSGTSSPVTREFGIWSYQYWSTVISTDGTYIFKTCHNYPDYVTLDSSWKAARAFSILTFIFAIIVVSVKCCATCSTDPDVAYGGGGKVVAPLYLITGLCQGLTLLFLNSDACKNNHLIKFAWEGVEWPETCSIATGAKCIISAMVFWLAAALASFQGQQALEKERTAVEPVSLTEPLAP